MHGHAVGNRLDLERAQLEVVAEIGFREQHDRLRATLPCEREIALDSADVVVQVEAADDEDDVHVGRDDLRLGLHERDLAHECASSRQDGVDRRRALVGTWRDSQPVADRGMLVGMPQPAGRNGTELTELRVDDVLAAMLDGCARGHEAVQLIRVERLGQRRVPAQGLEVQRDLLLRAWVPGKGAKSARRCRQEQSLSSDEHLLLSSRKPRRTIQQPVRS